FMNGETNTSLSQAPTVSTTATLSSPVGEYEIAVTGGSADNYIFQYLPGKLTITPALLGSTAISWSTPTNLTYDGNRKVFTASAAGVTNWIYRYVGTNSTTYGPKDDAPTEGGDYVVTATAGGGNYSGSDSRTFTIQRASQTILFGSLESKLTTDGDFELTATTSSGLPIFYTSSDTNVATVSGSTVTIVGLGITQISADQPGNRNYQAAATLQQKLTVSAPYTAPTLSGTVGLTALYVQSGDQAPGEGDPEVRDWASGGQAHYQQSTRADSAVSMVAPYVILGQKSSNVLVETNFQTFSLSHTNEQGRLVFLPNPAYLPAFNNLLSAQGSLDGYQYEYRAEDTNGATVATSWAIRAI
ncbi:MAG: hypothetical protein EBV83_10245, partial [Verrucomicrobia bacterium]|nr:hypothetical protein [Verrucomicrobiota bacterium]